MRWDTDFPLVQNEEGDTIWVRFVQDIPNANAKTHGNNVICFG